MDYATFSQAYNTYSPVIYGIAIRCTDNTVIAAGIVEGVFVKLYELNLLNGKPIPRRLLIQLVFTKTTDVLSAEKVQLFKNDWRSYWLN